MHTNTRTLLVGADRAIVNFPQGYTKHARIDNKFDFDPRVKQICDGERLANVGLKICKMIVIGDVSVGKTCLVNRFCKKSFDRDYKATIGVDFEVERFEILSRPFTLQMWDTAGQERFQCIAAAYYRGAHIVTIVFDVSDIRTLGNAKTWLAAAKKETPFSDDTLIFLVGTKRDLISDVSYKEVEREAVEVAEVMNAEFWCVSSKTGQRVKDFFFRVAALAFENVMLRELEKLHQAPSTQIGSGDGPLQLNNNKRDVSIDCNNIQSRCCKF